MRGRFFAATLQSTFSSLLVFSMASLYIRPLLSLLAESVSESERSVAALTGLPRTEWARILRENLESGINKDNMDLINKAVCMVSFYTSLTLNKML